MAATSAINYRSTSSLQLQTISPDVAHARLQFLRAEQKTKKAAGQTLSENKLNELRQLVDILVLNRDEVKLKVTIARANLEEYPTKFYTIEFNPDPATANVRRFNLLSEQTNTMTRAITNASAPRAFLPFVIQPTSEMSWYQQATLDHMNAVFSNGFLDGVQHLLKANLYLLISAARLSNNPEVFNQILNIHTLSYGLYQDQVDFNQSCTGQILEHAKNADDHASRLRDVILSCGPNLTTPPDDFLPRAEAIAQKDARSSLALYTVMDAAFETFLGKIAEINTQINACIGQITSRQAAIEQMIPRFQHLEQDRLELKTQAGELEKKYKAFVAAKGEEFASRKKEVSEGSFFIFSWSTTKYVQADLDSAGLLGQYKELEKKNNELEEKISGEQDNLRALLIANAPGCTPDQLQAAADALGIALMHIYSLRAAIQIKQSQTQHEINLLNQKLCSPAPTASSSGDSQQLISNVGDAIDLFKLMQDKTPSSQALWIQLSKGVHTLQKVRFAESECKESVAKSVLTGNHQGITHVEQIIDTIKWQGMPDSGERLLTMVSNQELLDYHKID